MRGHEIDLVDDLREALHSAPLVVFRNQDPATIVQLGRRRRRTRRLLAAGVVAALAVSVAVAIRPLGTTAVTPATDRTGTKVQTPEEDAAWQAWADCLRQAEVPGVVVTGPEPGDGTIGYTDTQGDPLPRNYREENPEWGSATEYCAERVPGLLPRLEEQWGDLTTGPARADREVNEYERCLADRGLDSPRSDQDLMAAESVGCVWAPDSPEADRVLDCAPGEAQEGWRSIRDMGTWVKTPHEAAAVWLERQSDRAKFATAMVEGEDFYTKQLLIKSTDGRTTGIVSLLSHRDKGYRLQGMNVCSAD